MKRKRPKIPYHTPWTPFEQCTSFRNGDQDIQIPGGIFVYRNNIYTVNMELGDAPPFGEITWLSIKRNDRHPIHDWRDLQRIKNELCGLEREAVELYPAESRMVDQSNQYHLWVMPDGYRFPFGYAERSLVDETVGDATFAAKARQRAWAPGSKPIDARSGKDYDTSWRDDPKFVVQRVVHKRKVS